MAAGEVLLNGTQITDGSVNSVASAPKLLDGNALTGWGGAGALWAGIDAGVVCTLTRVRLSPFAPNGNLVIGAKFQANTVPSFAAALIIQYNQEGVNATNQSSVSLAFNSAQNPGSTNIVFVTAGVGQISSVTDNDGNTYTLQASPANGCFIYCYKADSIAGTNTGTGGRNHVTVAYSTNQNFPSFAILEYSGGLSTGSSLDGSSSASGTGTAVNSGSFTTTSAHDMLIAAADGGGAVTFTPGTGFTMRGSVSNWNFGFEDQFVTSAGSYAGTFTINSSQSWQCLCVAFKTPEPPPVTLLTFSQIPNYGTLLNEYTFAPGTQYRYYAYYGSLGSNGTIGDLDIIVQYTPGVVGAAVAPVISPAGGMFDFPVVVALSSITTDAAIYYTTDGTTPTISSNLYNGPFVFSGSTLKAIAVSSGLSNSRVSTANFTFPATIISTATMYDNRPYMVWAINPAIFRDPVSGWWYMYGANYDQNGVQNAFAVNIYRSADLRNWIFRRQDTVLSARPSVLYNAANNNYVLWGDGANGINSYVGSSPEGPFTLVNAYTTINGFGSSGDSTTFLDTDGVSAYISYQQYQTNISFFKLSTDFQSVTATGNNYAMPSSGGTWGGFVESPHIFKRGSTYFMIMSGTTLWAPDTNKYWTATSPLGPWGPNGGINPFVQIQGGTGYQDYTIAYDTQDMGAIIIPGRDDGSGQGAYFYIGDAYNTGLSSSQGTAPPPATFNNYTLVQMPITFPTSTSMSINYNDSWTFDGSFPSTRRPGMPTSFGWTGSTFTWSNSEPNPVCMYLDFANDPNFNNVARSEFIGESNSINSYSPVFPHSQAGFYRLRIVNASGTSFSLPGVAPFQNWNAFGIKPVNSKNIQHLQTINAVTVNAGTVSSAQATLTNIVSRDIICVRVSWQSSSGSVSSVSGSLNGSYLSVPGSLQSYYGQTTAWYYLASSSSGNDTITATLSGSLPGVVIEATELSPWEVYTATTHGPNNPPIIAPYNPGGPRWNNLNVIQDYIDKFNSQNIYLRLPHP